MIRVIIVGHRVRTKAGRCCSRLRWDGNGGESDQGGPFPEAAKVSDVLL